ncbi:MAG: Integral membrane protein TerC, partial [uncultured Solirubrobacterales bacterium]
VRTDCCGATRLGRPSGLSRPDDRRRSQGGLGEASYDGSHRRAVERHMGLARRRLWRGSVGPRGLRRRRGLLRGLRYGKGAVARQRLRLHADLLCAGGAARRAAARPPLGHPHCARPASGLHLRGRGGTRDLQLGGMAVRRAAGLDGLEDPALRRRARRGREDRRSRAWSLSWPQAERRRPCRRRPCRRYLRRRLGSGDPRHHDRHLHRLQRQRVCAAGPARSLLPCGRRGLAVRVPSGRARRAADRHRRQARLRGGDWGEDPDRADPRRHRRRSGGGDRSFAREGAPRRAGGGRGAL